MIMERCIGGLIACSTHRGLKEENQDRCRCGDLGSYKILVLADGVTRTFRGGQAADIAVNTFYDVVKKACDAEEMDISVFKRAYGVTVEHLEQTAKKEISESEHRFETTLIAIVESEDRFFITYLGDGRIYLVRGDLEQGIQLMVTHRVGLALGGALAPYGLLSSPVYIEHSKSFTAGEVIVTGTDGAFELETEGYEPVIRQVLHRLKNKNVLRNNDALTETLKTFLQELADTQSLHDNATIGVIITERAKNRLAGEE
jgi:hypothetical protein